MINENNNENNIYKGNEIIIGQKEELSSQKENEKKEYNDLQIKNNFKNKPNENFPLNLYKKKSNENIKSDKNLIQELQINPSIIKVKTFNKERRIDKYGNIITHGGKQKVTFIDKVSKNHFTEVIKIENYKQYNKMEEITNNKGNNCCILL